MIRFSCTGCGKPFAVADDTAGRRARCKKCGTMLVIPEPAAPPANTIRIELPDLPRTESAPSKPPTVVQAVSGPKMTLNCVSLLRPGPRSVWNFGWPSWRSCGPAWRHAQIIYKAVYQAAPMMNSQIATIRFLHGQEATWRPRRVAPAQTR